MKKIRMILTVAMATMIFGSSVYAETAPAETAAEETADETVILGKKTETAYEITMTNATGRPITEVTLKSDQDKDFSENLLEKEDVFEAEEVYILYCEKQDENKADLTYDLKIAFNETESYVIHEIPFKSLKDSAMKVCALDGVAYLEYVDAETDKEISTKEAEEARKNESAAPAATETVSNTSDSYNSSTYEESYDDYSYDDYSYDDYSYDDYSYDDYSYDYEESYEEPEQDMCLEDGLMW